jgi:hypothetical protein
MVPPSWGFVLLLQVRVHGWAIDAWWRQVFRCVKGVVLGLCGLDARFRLPSVLILGR